MIYYGDEIGMTGGDDPDDRRDFPGGWKEDTANAFEASGRDEVRQDLFQSIRTLAHIRAATSALRHGTLVEVLVEDDAYPFARVAGGSRVLVVFNQAKPPANLHIPAGRDRDSERHASGELLGHDTAGRSATGP